MPTEYISQPQDRKAIVEHIVVSRFSRDDAILLQFQKYVKKNASEKAALPFSRTTWEIFYFLCKGLVLNERIFVSDIYTSLGISKTGAIRYLNQLEECGLLTKTEDASDKRRKILKFSSVFSAEVERAVDQCVTEFGAQLNKTDSKRQIFGTSFSDDEISRLRTFAGISSDWFWETDQNLNFTWVSIENWDRVAFDPEYFLGKSCWDLHQPGTVNEKMDMIHHRSEIALRKPFRDFIFRHISQEGEEIWSAVSGEPVFSDAGKFSGYIGTGRAVTKRHELLEEVRQSEEQYRLISTLSSDFTWHLNQNLELSDLSGGYEKVTGRYSKQALGRQLFSNMFPASEAEQAKLNTLKHYLENRLSFRDFVSRELSADGTPLWLQLSGAPLFDEQGNFDGYFGIGKDITARINEELLTGARARIYELLLHEHSLSAALSEVFDLFDKLFCSAPVYFFSIHGEDLRFLGAANNLQRREGAKIEELLLRKIKSVHGVFGQVKLGATKRVNASRLIKVDLSAQDDGVWWGCPIGTEKDPKGVFFVQGHSPQSDKNEIPSLYRSLQMLLKDVLDVLEHKADDFQTFPPSIGGKTAASSPSRKT